MAVRKIIPSSYDSGQLSLIVMLKPFKLNTINFSSQIFYSPSDNCQSLPANSPMPNYNKRFKYGYKKSSALHPHPKKQRRFTIDLPQYEAEDEGKSKEDVANVINQPQGDPAQRRKTASHQTYINNFIFQGSKYTKRSQPPSSKSTCFPSHKPHKHSSPNPNAQNHKHNESQGHKADKQASPGDTTKQRTSNDHNRGYPSFSDKKLRSTPKSKRMNSILQSYKVKSIELADPLGRLPYHFDFSHPHDSQEICFQDLERIQLQKVKCQTKRSLSHAHCRKRPMTSKPMLRDDFQPRPWQSQQREGEEGLS